MAVTVIVSPALMVPILELARYEPIEGGFQIRDQPGLELDGRDPCGRSSDENRGDAGFYAGVLDGIGNLRRNVEDVMVSSTVDGFSDANDHHFPYLAQ